MKNILYLLIAAISGVVISSCHKEADNSHLQDARELYGKSVKLTALYTDSMLKATDSATVLRLNKSFDDAMTRLNFDYPADTDTDMKEEQNDTLTRMNIRFVAVRDSLLYNFAHPIAKSDSLATDSITQ